MATAAHIGKPARDQLLDEALALFLEFGLRRTRMDDLAQRMGISRATLYRQFQDRTALVQSVIMRECQRAMADVQRQLEERPVTDWGREGLFLTVRTAARHPLLQRLLDVDAEYLLPVLTIHSRDTLRWAHRYVTAMVEMLQARNVLPAGQAAETAELLLRLLHSWLLTPAGDVDVRDDADLRRYIDTFLWPLLAKRPPAVSPQANH
ncbi:MAG: TetR/AcrR family transcriptional regulator [Alcanivoracaceae bacterium]|nr:TetR/AcrR family transcriptional regulator [Alcanivoracaceae bacterium]